MIDRINDAVSSLKYLYLEGRDNPNLEEVFLVEDISLPLAVCVGFGYATLTESGLKEISETQSFLLEVVESLGLESIYDLVDVEEVIQPRKMKIRLDENGRFV
jgi:hypothetical protein